MKEIDRIFYKNKTQSESLKRFIIFINSFSVSEDGIILNGQYVRGIPFQDETNDTHYILEGMMAIEILCTKATILSPKERKTNDQNLAIYSSGFLKTVFTLCFDDENEKYHEVKCNDFYILKSEGFYKIFDEYIPVKKYREMEALKNKSSKRNSTERDSAENNYADDFWKCEFCDGNETTGCLWNDITECPRL